MSSKQKKCIKTVTAAVLVLALGLAGTFAASSSTESDGKIEDTVTTSIVLHDDFSKNWEGSVRNRDVYVENTGDSSLYVRMRLDEFMRYGGKKLVGGDEHLSSTWKPHRPDGKDVTDCGSEIHDYFTIQMGNDTGVKYKPHIKNAYESAVPDADKTKATSTAKVVTIEEYLTAETKPEPCWILDTADGYAYWYTQLQKGSATGLILNSITNTGLIDESYYYGINAKAEAVTEMDLSAWLHGRAPKDSVTGEAFDQASANAIRLLKNMSPKYIEITQDMKDNGADDFDSDNDGYLTKQENIEYEAVKGITPSPDPKPQVNVVKEAIKATDIGKTVSVKNAAGSTFGENTNWVILSKNENEAVLITEKMVTTRVYNKTATYPTWSKSDLRAWLNGGTSGAGDSYANAGYIDTLGTDIKQILKEEAIKTAAAYNNWNTQDASTDKVYLLTESWSASKLVSKNPDQSAITSLMKEEQMKCGETTLDGKNTLYWWLRSPHDWTPNPQYRAGAVGCSTGKIEVCSNDNPYGIRPCVTVTLN